MRGTPQWDVSIDRGHHGVIRDSHGIRVAGPIRKASLATGLCECITCDAYGNRLIKDDKSGPQVHYELHDAPLTWDESL